MTLSTPMCEVDDGGVGGYTWWSARWGLGDGSGVLELGVGDVPEGGVGVVLVDLESGVGGKYGCQGAARIDVGVRGQLSDVGVVERLRDVGVGGRC